MMVAPVDELLTDDEYIGDEVQTRRYEERHL